MNTYEQEFFNTADPHKLWVYDKLIVSKMLGYTCGPVGIDVPRPGNYIVRPVMNVLGMGRNTLMYYLRDSTDHLPPGSFWCEIFYGDHLSVDYINGRQQLCVQGLRASSNPFWKWNVWTRIKRDIPFPNILDPIRYPIVNCEFIGGRLIEIHLRRNPDFPDNRKFVIPVWGGESTDPPADNMEYEPNPDWRRQGFFVGY